MSHWYLPTYLPTHPPTQVQTYCPSKTPIQIGIAMTCLLRQSPESFAVLAIDIEIVVFTYRVRMLQFMQSHAQDKIRPVLTSADKGWLFWKQRHISILLKCPNLASIRSRDILIMLSLCEYFDLSGHSTDLQENAQLLHKRNSVTKIF